MTQQRSHFFLDVDDDVRLTQIFGQAGVLSAKFLDFFFHRLRLDCDPGSELRGFPGPALAASKSAETSTDLRGGEGRQGPRVVAATSASCKMRCLYPLCR